MNIYGSQIWLYSKKCPSKFYICWRKAPIDKQLIIELRIFAKYLTVPMYRLLGI